MNTTTDIQTLARSTDLKFYYYLRLAVSAIWVLAAFTLGMMSQPLSLLLLVAYPAWDAFANWLDANKSGGLAKNPSQTLNIVVSTLTALSVLVASQKSMNAILAVFGAWAILSGILQLATGVRRWKLFGAQWAMILSGAQSALAGGFFIKEATSLASVNIGHVAPYAAFGAFYFGVSALSLTIMCARMKKNLRAQTA